MASLYYRCCNYLFVLAGSLSCLCVFRDWTCAQSVRSEVHLVYSRMCTRCQHFEHRTLLLYKAQLSASSMFFSLFFFFFLAVLLTAKRASSWRQTTHINVGLCYCFLFLLHCCCSRTLLYFCVLRTFWLYCCSGIVCCRSYPSGVEESNHIEPFHVNYLFGAFYFLLFYGFTMHNLAFWECYWRWPSLKCPSPFPPPPFFFLLFAEELVFFTRAYNEYIYIHIYIYYI